jgi:proteasome lid subunit RPN8/RPN11
MSRNKDSGYDSDTIINEVRLIGGQARLRMIYGHEYSMYPYNCIGLICGNYSGKKIYATGSLLSSNIVLTAANTILSVEKDKMRKIAPEQLVFYPQTCGELKGGKESMVIDYKICSKYEEKVVV